MSTKITVSCKNGHVGTVEIEQKIRGIMVGGDIVISDPGCPVCGKTMSAPSGNYQRDEDGEMIRIGDFEHNPKL